MRLKAQCLFEQVFVVVLNYGITLAYSAIMSDWSWTYFQIGKSALKHYLIFFIVFTFDPNVKKILHAGDKASRD